MPGPRLYRLILPLLLGVFVAGGLVSCTEIPDPPDVEPIEGEEDDPECTEDDDCGDGDPCTVGQCVAGTCVFSRGEMNPTLVGTVQTRGPAAEVKLQSQRWLHAALGDDGVETFDLRPLPEEPATLARHRPTTGPALGVDYFRDHLFVVSGPTGIEVFPGDADEAISLYRTLGDVRSVLQVDGLVVASVGAKGLEVIDYSNPATPLRHGRVETFGRAERAVRHGGTLYVADGLGGVAEVDFRERDAPVLRPDRRIPTEGRVMAVTRRNELLVLAEWGVGLGVFDLDRRGEEDRASVTIFDAPARALRTLSRHTALVAADSAGLILVDLIDPTRPRILDRIELDGPAVSLDRSGERVAVALGDAGVAIVDLGCTVEDE